MDISDSARRLMYDLLDHWRGAENEKYYLQIRFPDRYITPNNTDRTELPLMLALRAEWGDIAKEQLIERITRIMPDYRAYAIEKAAQEIRDLAQRAEEMRQREVEQKRRDEEREIQQAVDARKREAEQKRLDGVRARKQLKDARKREVEQKRLDEEKARLRAEQALQREEERKRRKREAESEKRRIAAQRKIDAQAILAKQQKIDVLCNSLTKLMKESSHIFKR